jgi:hypothetical protein
MLTFLLHIRTAWNDYFPGTYTKIYNSQKYSSRQEPSSTGVYVSNCLFISITSSSSGGALSCTSATYFLVESSSFFSCWTGGNGGAIYFCDTNNGQCVLHEVCGYDCRTTNSNNIQFAYILVCNIASSNNFVNYSSISRCVNENSNAYYTLCHHYGKIIYQSVNSSMNKIGARTFYCNPISDSNSVTGLLSHSSFTDNTVALYTCIMLWTTGAKFEIKSCNIIRNTQPLGNGEGTIHTRGTVIIEDSCILENTATHIFHQYSSYTITLSNCTVDKTTNNGYLTTKNTVTKSFILALNHMSTQNCHSEYDSAGTLIPIIQTPSSSKKQRLCYTGDKFFHHLQPRDFFSLIGILFFNFIHLYPINHFY